MVGIDIRQLELIGSVFILGKPIRSSMNGILYKSEMYLNGIFFSAEICQFWFGGGKAVKIYNSKGEDCLSDMQDKIEELLQKSVSLTKQYVSRSIIKGLSVLSQIIATLLIIYTLYYAIFIKEQEPKRLVITLSLYTICFVISKIVYLKTYGLRFIIKGE